jgi:conjugative transfer region protein (TIGR03748 family)
MRCTFIGIDGSHVRPRAVLAAVCAWLTTTSGCTATSPRISEPPRPVLADSTPVDPALVVRHGRYTLVELTPESAQHDLMQQLVDLTFPATLTRSVGDALRYLLLRSGYRLSDDCDASQDFDAWPLPAPHVHLGPLTLRHALEVLVGPGWQLQRDDALRHICFVRAADPTPLAVTPSIAITGQSNE